MAELHLLSSPALDLTKPLNYSESGFFHMQTGERSACLAGFKTYFDNV